MEEGIHEPVHDRNRHPRGPDRAACPDGRTRPRARRRDSRRPVAGGHEPPRAPPPVDPVGPGVEGYRADAPGRGGCLRSGHRRRDPSADRPPQRAPPGTGGGAAVVTRPRAA
ncbi:hypothetical protein P5712_07550 [Methylobacterium fujisawaense]|nr:hypothetical protein [Methylobacterium fujisawaense]MDH3028688.1 hypothetical protein [Methylobacterium fujisawaense]